MNNSVRRGFAPVPVIIVVLVVAAGFWFLISSGRVNLPKSSTGTSQTSPTVSIDKSDPNWIRDYCKQEIQKLPEAPMTYKEKGPVERNAESPYIADMSGLDDNPSSTCQIAYSYDEEVAYASVGVEHIFDIKYGNAFAEKLAEIYDSNMPGGWEQLPRLDDKTAGRPGYATDALPLVYRRETADTVEYLEVFDAVDFYVELTVYEK